MSEFYDLSEIPLNNEGEAWGNLGYWHGAEGYSQACRALAGLLGEHAALDFGCNVLDVGFGCGDQLLLWLSEFQVQSITGVNYSHSQTRQARQRLLDSHYGERADLVEGDVDDAALWHQWRERQLRVDRVLALDCLYHFPCRQAFWTRAAEVLNPNGRIAMTDFMLAGTHKRDSLAHRALQWMLKQSRIPEHNLVYREQYIAQLQQSGFSNVEVVDISEPVMQGFWCWTRRRQLPWRRWLKYEVTGRFLHWAYRKQVLRYCLVVATR